MKRIKTKKLTLSKETLRLSSGGGDYSTRPVSRVTCFESVCPDGCATEGCGGGGGGATSWGSPSGCLDCLTK